MASPSAFARLLATLNGPQEIGRRRRFWLGFAIVALVLLSAPQWLSPYDLLNVGYILSTVFLAFGLFSVLFGVLVLGRQYLERKVQKLKATHRPDPAKCKACGKCSVENKKDEDLFKATCNCDVFGPIGASCDHDAHELEAREKKPSRFGPRYGLALGLFRGATPCAKMMLLAPLLIVSDLPLTIAILLVYAAASTVYPVIGLMSARIISKVKVGSVWIKAAGAMVVLIVGIYSIMKFVTWDPNECFQ